MNDVHAVPVLQRARKARFSLRKRTIAVLVLTVGFLLTITVAGVLCGDAAVTTDFTQKNFAPSFADPFGTDWLGRDMLARTLRGLSISIFIGLGASTVSAVIALILGTMAATLGSKVDAVITWLVDLLMGIPHLLLLILISFALGKGTVGVIVASIASKRI